MPKEGDSVSADYTTWKKVDRFVLVWICSTLSADLLCYVARGTRSYDAWKLISNTFQSQTRAKLMNRKGQIQNLSKGSLSMMDYIEKKRSVVDSLAECQYFVPDDEFVASVLHGLDSSYGPFKSAINVRLEAVSPEELFGPLLSEEERLLADSSPTTPTTITPPAPPAEFTAPPTTNNVSSFSQSRSDGAPRGRGCGDKGRGRGRGSFTEYNTSPQSNRPICQICDRIGHPAKNCFNRFESNAYPPTYPQKSANHVAPSTTGEAPWYVDSGVSHHVTANMKNLSLRSEYDGNDQLALGDEYKLD